MDQRITLKIAGKEYPLNAKSPEMERLMRLAADDVNSMLLHMDQKFADTTLEDKLAFVALQEAAGKLTMRSKLAKAKADTESLHKDINDYLESMNAK